MRQVAERQRRKKGIPVCKGVDATCAGCGGSYIRNSRTNTHCSTCLPELKRAIARERVNRLCRERGAPEVGRIIPCKHCGTEFATTSPKSCYCEKCSLEAQRMRLTPSQRDWRSGYVKNYLEQKKLDPEYEQKERIRQRKSREKRKLNPAFSINERMSASVRQSLAGGKQGWRWERLVGYKLADLMAHLERQFLPNMTWQNRGEWHIDHIIPLASFRFESADDPEFRRAWSLPNLRPLWAAENIKKNNRITHLL